MKNNMERSSQRNETTTSILTHSQIIKSITFIPALSLRTASFNGSHQVLSHIQNQNIYKCRPTRSRCHIRMSVAEDPVANRLREELAADGINLDELLNAGKVVNLTRKLDKLIVDSEELEPNSSEYVTMQEKIAKIERTLITEKRQVMQAWLKNLFFVQSIIFGLIGGVLASDIVPGYSVPLVGQALGFWMIWLFTIPSLRARKGTPKWEKSALNIAFLITPLMNLVMPFATKNCGAIWAVNVTVLIGCYAYYAVSVTDGDGGGKDGKTKREQARVTGILKYLDWGSWKR